MKKKKKTDFITAIYIRYNSQPGNSSGTDPNWQQAEDVASFRQSNLASVIADRISGPVGGCQERRHGGVIESSSLDLIGK